MRHACTGNRVVWRMTTRTMLKRVQVACVTPGSAFASALMLGISVQRAWTGKKEEPEPDRKRGFARPSIGGVFFCKWRRRFSWDAPTVRKDGVEMSDFTSSFSLGAFDYFNGQCFCHWMWSAATRSPNMTPLLVCLLSLFRYLFPPPFGSFM